jgi:hypothetical protein
MDYPKIAGQILFGSRILDNSHRGLFIEALAIAALHRHQGTRPTHRWCLTGYGWKPWDLQRGVAAYGTRVRVQVKATAAEQLWTPTRPSNPQFSLGWDVRERFPDYFTRDMDPWYFGQLTERDLTGYLCDIHLLAWHGPLKNKTDCPSDQSDPCNYHYFVVQSAALAPRRHIRPAQLLETADCALVDYEHLPAALDEAADTFLARLPRESVSDRRNAPL